MVEPSIEEDANQESRKYSIAKITTEELDKVLTNLIDWIKSSLENCTHRTDMLQSTEVNGAITCMHTVFYYIS